jgi:hypothetical protein
VRGNRSCPLASEPATTPAAATDLISFLNALPDCRMRMGIRFPQWWMLVVAILSILSGQGSVVGTPALCQAEGLSAGVAPPPTLNELLGSDFGKTLSDSSFRLLLAQLAVAGLEALLRDWGPLSNK